ncbi:MAG: hypothetical protein Q4A32_02650 [Lachnospiraceae bacterium]|nr:hypothetical protein [Lachnospiraceae bacterium]
MKKKYVALILAATMTVGLAACGSQASTTSATASTEEAQSSTSDSLQETDFQNAQETEDKQKAEGTSVTARVDKVDGNKIEVTLGELENPGKPGGSSDQGGPGGNGGNGEAPDMNGDSSANGGNGQTPPDLPNGEAPDMNGDFSANGGNGQTPPDLPDGEAPDTDSASAGKGGRKKPDMSSLFTASEKTATYEIEESMLDGITLDDIKEGTILTVTLDADGNVEKIAEASMMGPGGMGKPGDGNSQGDSDGKGKPGDGNGGPGGQGASSITYTAATTYTEDTETSGETYGSTGTDENAVLVDNGAEVTIAQAAVSRNSSDSTGGDNSSFYGVGAAMLAKDGTLTVKNSDITTDAAGGAGVFAYGDGTACVEDTTIKTSQGTSGGIHVAGGGTLYAWDLDVTTDGASSAAIRSDRGGGTMVVDGGTYTSNGSGSPAVYTTADITVNDATLTATGSEAICIEGLNTLRLFDCYLTGNMPNLSQNDNTWTVIVYQSMSGDSEIGTGNFSMVGGTLTSKNGGLFYTTNTESEILLSDVDITYSDSNDFFLQVTGNTNERGWGQEGANGAQCTFTSDNQKMQGKIIYDSISTLDFYMTNGSSLKGSFEDVETWAGEGGDGYCNVYVGKDSTWVVTDDSSVDALYAAGSIKDENGKTVTIKGEDGTVYVEGDSEYTVTVSSYQTEDKSGDALEVPSYSDYEVEKA